MALVARCSPVQATETLGDIVHIGDAFDLINDVNDGAVDLILTSPPFWGLRTYGLEHREDVLDQWTATGISPEEPPTYDWYRRAGGILGLEPYPQWYIAHLVEFFMRALPKLNQSGSLWVNLGDTYFARWSSIRDSGRQGYNGERTRRRTPSTGFLRDKQLLMVPARFAIAMQDAGWILRNDLIWSKPNVMPRPESDRLRLSHEHWFHFVRRNPRGRPKYYYDLTSCEAGTRDVVVQSTVAGSDGHTAAFPPELVKPRILSSCPPNGLVLDPFCGTARALIESIQAGRRAIGFELSDEFGNLAQARVASAIEHHHDSVDRVST